MDATKLKGVIAAIATAVGGDGAPDCARSTALARYLLANGCDGLNVLGTTGTVRVPKTAELVVSAAPNAHAITVKRLIVSSLS